MRCPFCQGIMRPGRLRSRHYATVWTPAESKRGWLPPPYDALSREGRGEAIVVNGERPAHWCESCQAVLVDPLPEEARWLYGPDGREPRVDPGPNPGADG